MIVPASTAAFRLQTLGRLSVGTAESPLTGAAARRRSLALLALAAASGSQGVDVERALAFLWPEFDVARARNNLKQVVYCLRQALGPDIFIRDASTLALNPAMLSVDLWEFEHDLASGALERAVDLYSDEFLAGFHIAGLADFERWADTQRQRIDYLFVGALERLAAATNDAVRAVPIWQRLTRHDQLSDRYALGLVRALAEIGDVSGALQFARTHETLLRQELDVEPSIEFRQLAYRLRVSDSPPSPSPLARRGGSIRGSESVAPQQRDPFRTTGQASGSDDERVMASVSRIGVASDADATITGPARVDSRLAAARDGAAGKQAPTTSVRAALPIPARFFASRWTRIGIAACVVILVSLGATSLGSLRAAGPGAANTVVVLPFTISGAADPGGLVPAIPELLATSIDGSLGLRAVPAPIDRERAGNPTTRDENLRRARAVAAQLGVSEFVWGEITGSGTRLRVTAELRDRNADSGEPTRATVEGDRSDLLSMVDRLAAQLLAMRFDGARGEVARVAAVTTSSLEAAKSYFTGDEAMRAGRFQAATDAYHEAIRLDSSFALAHFALSTAAEILGQNEIALREAGLALHYSARLPYRQRRLLGAYFARQRGDATSAEQQYTQITIEYPSDAEGWLGLGEALFHLNPLRGRSPAQARNAFERAATLDPRNASALVHLARIASLEGNGHVAESMVARARALSSAEGIGRIALHVLALGGASPDASVGGEQLEDTAGVEHGPSAIDLLTRGRILPVEDFAAQFITATAPADLRGYGYRLLSLAAAGRGRMAEAMALLDSCEQRDPVRALESRSRLAALDFVPLSPRELDVVRKAVREWTPDSHLTDDPIDSISHTNAHASLRLHRLALLALRAGDTAEVTVLARRLAAISRVKDGEGEGDGEGEEADFAATLASSVYARLGAARGRYGAALVLLDGAGWEGVARTSPMEAYDRLLRAQLLAKLGRDDEALAFFSRIGERSPQELPLVWSAELGMAQIFERRGDRAQAARYYRSVARRLARSDSTVHLIANDATRRADALER